MPVNDEGGTLRVELNHQDRALLPDALRSDENDHRILAVARNLSLEARHLLGAQVPEGKHR